MTTFKRGPMRVMEASRTLCAGDFGEECSSLCRGDACKHSCEEPSALLSCRDSSLPLLSLPFLPSSSLSSPSSSPRHLLSLPVSPSLHPFPLISNDFDTYIPSIPSIPSPLPTSRAPPVPPLSKSVTEGDGECEGRGRKGKRKAMMGRPPSCNFCHISKVKCTPNSFPCHRCVRNNRGHLCKEWKSQQPVHSLLQKAGVLETPSIKRSRTEEEAPQSQISLFSFPSSPSIISSSSSESSTSPPPPPLPDDSPFCFNDSNVVRLLSDIPSLSFSALPSDAPFDLAVSRSILRTIIRLVFKRTKKRILFHSLRMWLISRRLHSLMSEEDFETLRHISRAVKVSEDGNLLEEEEELGRRERLSEYPPGFNEGVVSRCKCLRCMEVASVLRIHHSVYSFAASPLQPLPDLDYNNHPTLIFNRTPNCPGYAALLERLRAHLGVEGGKPPAPVSSPFVLSYSVTVNRAFERLFGYSQSEMRRLFMKYEWKAPFVLLDRGEWEAASTRDFIEEFRPPDQGSAMMEERGWEERVTCVDKWGRSFDCMMVRSYMFDDDARCSGMHTTFLAAKKRLLLGAP